MCNRTELINVECYVEHMTHALNCNRLISQLDTCSQDQLLKRSDWIAFIPDQVLTVASKGLEYAYFPVSGVVALMMQQQKDKPIALTLIGQEGMIGVAAALGVAQEPCSCLVLSAGNALRVSVSDLYALKLKNRQLCIILDRYVAVINARFAQAIVCHSRHELQQRMSCLLLGLSDRVLAKDFTMTQARLADLLGVRRSGINKVARALQYKQILEYSRGNIHILNRLALLKTACQCYAMDQQSYQSILEK